MRWLALILVLFGLCACSSDAAQVAMADGAPQTATPPVSAFATRPLSPIEKTNLAQSLARAMKDHAAKFQWVPVKYIPGSPSTEYCALANGRNYNGKYDGYRIFHAVIYLDDNGLYTSGILDGLADDVVKPNSNGLKYDTRLAAACMHAGYADLLRVR